MADAYSDEEWRALAEEPIGWTAEETRRAVSTCDRFRRERDAAERVAKVLATRGRATEAYNDACRTALAYPDRGGE